jgi:hypothetical protein
VDLLTTISHKVFVARFAKRAEAILERQMPKNRRYLQGWEDCFAFARKDAARYVTNDQEGTPRRLAGFQTSVLDKESTAVGPNFQARRPPRSASRRAWGPKDSTTFL